MTHLTEFFGPVLGVMRFEDLTEAIDIVNGTGYGLTSAIHSLDDREIAQWKGGIRAGNLYINRGTTGAIVLRQPFGGMGKSCFGPGLKAGGPNYVASFLRFADRPAPTANVAALAAIRNADLASLVEEVRSSRAPSETAWLLSAIASYDAAWSDEFSKEHDHFRLIGQDNFRRYLPFREVCLRITAQDRFEEVVARAAAARVTGARVLACFAPGAPKEWRARLDEWTDSWAAGIEIFEQTDAAFAQHVRDGHWPRIRFAGREQVSSDLRKIAAESGTWLADVPVVSEGRVELLWYLREQSLSHDYHRYGNLGARASEPRRPLVPPTGGNRG